MALLTDLRAAAQSAAKALRDAEDRLGLARESARASITLLADLECRALMEPVTTEQMSKTRAARDRALVAIKQIETELFGSPIS